MEAEPEAPREREAVQSTMRLAAEHDAIVDVSRKLPPLKRRVVSTEPVTVRGSSRRHSSFVPKTADCTCSLGGSWSAEAMGRVRSEGHGRTALEILLDTRTPGCVLGRGVGDGGGVARSEAVGRAQRNAA